MAVELPILPIIAIPLVASVTVFCIHGRGKVPVVSSTAILLTAVYVLSIVITRRLPIVENYAEITLHERGEPLFSLAIDRLNAVLLLTAVLLFIPISVYSHTYIKHRAEELGASLNIYYGLLLLNVAGILGWALAYNIILFLIFLEITMLTSFGIILLYGYGNRMRVAFTYLVWSLVGSTLVIIGAGGVYAHLHALSFDLHPLSEPPLWIPYVMLIGFAIKMGAAGVHMWLPLAHAEAPSPFSAVLSPLIIGMAGYGILRIVKPLTTSSTFLLVVLLWAIASIVYGGLGALVENDVKRILAYSSISHMGYLLLAITIQNEELATTAYSYNYLAHAYGKALLFLCAGILVHFLGTRDMRVVSGVLSMNRLCGIAFILGFLCLMGLPPTAGFMSKLILIVSALESSSKLGTHFTILAIVAAISTLISVAYSIRVIRHLVLGSQKPESRGIKLPLDMKLSLILIMILMIIFWAFPNIITSLTTS